MTKIKEKIYSVIEDDVTESLLHKLFEGFIVALIILNVLAIIAASCLKSEGPVLRDFEVFSVIVFSIEYLLRLWTADLKFKNSSGFKARVRLIFSPMGLIDIASILPFYLTLLLPVALDGRVLRVLRLLRLLRIFKLTRFLDSFGIIKSVIRKRKYELLMTGFIAFIVIMIASTLMYELEHDAQPDKFTDIISSFWWAIATLTTIGYGDMYPVTGAGKFISAVISLVGIGLIALPTGILSTSFIEEFRNRGEIQDKNEKPNVCPHCGKTLDS